MKKLILLFISLLAIGSVFQSCDDTKTYAEMLEEEKDAVNAFIKKHNIRAISEDEFIRNDTTTQVDKDGIGGEYVAFPNGVYMQIVSKYDVTKYPDGDAPKFETNNLILTRFIEVDLLEDDTTAVSNEDNPYNEFYNIYPDGFRYTDSGTSVYGQFIYEAGLGFNMYNAYGTGVPAGWLIPLKYTRDGAHIRLIVPSKMGHQTAQQEVYPYYYDIRKFSIY